LNLLVYLDEDIASLVQQTAESKKVDIPPQRDENFRVRLSFAHLRQKAKWQVQEISISPAKFVWAE